jgi:uncharacterized protein involved in tolerance to divalent cations
MMIKTRTSRVPELTEYVQKHHPYDVPEVTTTLSSVSPFCFLLLLLLLLLS